MNIEFDEAEINELLECIAVAEHESQIDVPDARRLSEKLEGAKKCPYCLEDDEQPFCDGISPKGHYCTRGPGHEGDHVSCEPVRHNTAHWPNKG